MTSGSVVAIFALIVFLMRFFIFLESNPKQHFSSEGEILHLCAMSLHFLPEYTFINL